MSEAACDQILRDGDHKRLLKVWPEVFPHLQGPKTEADAEIVLHHARTQNPRIDLRLRAWSHRWLQEREIPSGLPDELRPKAEQICPIIQEGVFVSANTNSPLLKPVAAEIQQEMCNAVEEAAADGRLSDSAFVRGRMLDARARAVKRLLGTTIGRNA